MDFSNSTKQVINSVNLWTAPNRTQLMAQLLVQTTLWILKEPHPKHRYLINQWESKCKQVPCRYGLSSLCTAGVHYLTKT